MRPLMSIRLSNAVLIAAALASAVLTTAALAGKLTLNDGTVYEGAIKKLGTSYTIKLADGTVKLVTEADVASVDDPKLNATKPGAGTGAGAGSAATAAPADTGGDFARAKNSAGHCDTPLLAVTVWQKFIDDHAKNPSRAADVDAAKKELKRWQDMAAGGAERIKGKWVTGDDLKKLHAQVDQLMKEAAELATKDQTIKAIDKLQQVLKLYPNSFPANFEMGYYYLAKGGNNQYDKAITSLETASKLMPNSPETLSDLAIAYNFRRRYEDAVMSAYKAAQIEDTPPVVQNLINALSYAPPGMRANNPKVRPVVDEAKLLASKHGIGGPSGQWTYLRPHPRETSPDDDKEKLARRGIIGSGTGFFLTADGYILTNRHVAAAGDKMIVRLADGTQKVAEKIIVDDEQDIAILKIQSDSPLPFIKIAAYDEPPIGTDVTVMGFPLGAMMGTNVKITRGVVTSIEEEKAECDVIVDAQVNPGNSGGPMIDHYGNLMALVAMKTLSDEKISSYGLGISAGRLRKFFDHQGAKIPFKPTAGDKGGDKADVLSTEDIASKFQKATVMVLIVAGELPEGLK